MSFSAQLGFRALRSSPLLPGPHHPRCTHAPAHQRAKGCGTLGARGICRCRKRTVRPSDETVDQSYFISDPQTNCPSDSQVPQRVGPAAGRRQMRTLLQGLHDLSGRTRTNVSEQMSFQQTCRHILNVPKTDHVFQKEQPGNSRVETCVGPLGIRELGNQLCWIQ